MELQLHRTKVKNFLRNLRGQIFHVCWVKKNGTTRRANARLSVAKNLKSKVTSENLSLPYVTIYLMWNMKGDTFVAESGYRKLNLDTIKYIGAFNCQWEIKPEPILASVDLTTTHQQIPDNVIAMQA